MGGGLDGLMYFGQQDTIFPMHMEDGDFFQESRLNHRIVVSAATNIGRKQLWFVDEEIKAILTRVCRLFLIEKVSQMGS